jgi:hypothetical protein
MLPRPAPAEVEELQHAAAARPPIAEQVAKLGHEAFAIGIGTAAGVGAVGVAVDAPRQAERRQVAAVVPNLRARPPTPPGVSIVNIQPPADPKTILKQFLPILLIKYYLTKILKIPWAPKLTPKVWGCPKNQKRFLNVFLTFFNVFLTFF